ncbi:MAG: molybdopterin-dependent oxidoreductase [Marivibrio sp.]|uniref:molybdopterin-dependent oxidoreductase n=1 Tax=Marivibrio sp. TaxID=2039719 RepID=UPI0032EF3C5B
MLAVRRRGVAFSLGPLVAFAVLIATALGPAPAAPADDGRPILSVDGAVTDGPVVFDLAALTALGPVELSTSTPWTEGVRRFVGVPLAAVLDAAGAEGDSLRARALNDYASAMPIADAIGRGALLVWEMDGRRLSVRDKGPLWILFNFDGDPAVRTDAYLARSVWQLSRITVE